MHSAPGCIIQHPKEAARICVNVNNVFNDIYITLYNTHLPPHHRLVTVTIISHRLIRVDNDLIRPKIRNKQQPTTTTTAICASAKLHTYTIRASTVFRIM